MNGPSLYRHLEEQAQQEEAFEASRPDRLENAASDLTDIQVMSRFLGDHSDLAGPLVSIFHDFSASMEEMNEFALQGKSLYSMNLMRNVSRLRSMMIEMLAGER